jgi:hypothetical protein
MQSAMEVSAARMGEVEEAGEAGPIVRASFFG